MQFDNSSTISLQQSSNTRRPARNNLSSSLKKFNKSTKKLAKFCAVKKRGFDDNEKDILISNNTRSDSMSTTISNNISPLDQIQIVVLLINTVSRHFEVISCQLSVKESNVEDLLDVISETASEALKGVNFTGVLNLSGLEFKLSTRMKDCTSGKELMIAKIDSMTASECLEHARPLLKSPKLISMMRGQGIVQLESAIQPNALSSESSFRKKVSSHSKNIRGGCMAVVTKKVKFSKQVHDLTRNVDGNGFLYVTVLVFVTSMYVSLF